MFVYHFYLPATADTEGESFYFSHVREAKVALRNGAARLSRIEPGLIGDTIELNRSRLVDVPKRELLLRCMNQRRFLQETTCVATERIAPVSEEGQPKS